MQAVVAAVVVVVVVVVAADNRLGATQSAVISSTECGLRFASGDMAKRAAKVIACRAKNDGLSPTQELRPSMFLTEDVPALIRLSNPVVRSTFQSFANANLYDIHDRMQADPRKRPHRDGASRIRRCRNLNCSPNI
jgi:hypothetical protein